MTWHIRCVSCNETLRFGDTNHLEVMDGLIRHATTLAQMASMMDDPGLASYARLTLTWCDINVAWFAEHATHDLVPIDEYGRLSRQCYKRVLCVGCGVLQDCKLQLDHIGPCSPHPLPTEPSAR